MPSSTSSSDVYKREIPAGPWLKIFVFGLALVLIAVGLWEFRMRELGLVAGDLDFGDHHWPEERRKIDQSDVQLAILGSSRILFDTDLDIWQAETGHRPVQLALGGTSPRMFMADIADNTDFSGVLLVGVAPGLYFGLFGGYSEGVLNLYETESPSQWMGHNIHVALSRVFAFLDVSYALFPLLERHDIPNREGVRGQYLDVWKIEVTGDDRQTFTWERISRDPYLRQHATNAWMYPDPLLWPELNDDDVDQVIVEAKENIEKIRARGGEVVFVRSPSAGGFLEREKEYFPRERFWDRLVAETDSIGIHFEDYPELSEGMVVIEWSHLEKESAQRYSRALSHIVQEKLAEIGYELPESEQE